MLEFQQFYRRNLPHIQPPGATMFVTSMLDGAIPAHIQRQLSSEALYLTSLLEKIADPLQKAEQTYIEMKRLFGRWDSELDRLNEKSPRRLANTEIAQIVAENLHSLDGKYCRLLAYTIMPNHVHTVFIPHEEEPDHYFAISKIMHAWKRSSAVQANQLLGRSGKFWQHENYDHYARDGDELQRIIDYVKNNPVKAGLVQNWSDWRWTFVA